MFLDQNLFTESAVWKDVLSYCTIHFLDQIFGLFKECAALNFPKLKGWLTVWSPIFRHSRSLRSRKFGPLVSVSPVILLKVCANFFSDVSVKHNAMLIKH